MSQDVSTNDLMQVMKEGFAQIDVRFKGIDGRLDGIDKRFEQVDSKLDTSFAELAEAINVLSDSTDERFNRLETRVARMDATMVTKDYLDEKLFDLRGDAVAMIRRHERKFHFRTV